MHSGFLRGRLEPAENAPVEGEQVSRLAELPGLAIEQILSGSLPRPLRFEQHHDEWVLVLGGRARLQVAHEQIELAAGDWVLLPAGCAHTVIETEPGTNWLVIHLGRSE